jgi:hypothetical protein
MLTPDPTVWRRPIARFLKELKANETVRFSSTQNFDSLRLNLEFIRENRRGLSSDVTWERTFKVVMLLEPLAEAADVLARGICVPSNIILGALELIIDVSVLCYPRNRELMSKWYSVVAQRLRHWIVSSTRTNHYCRCSLARRIRVRH